MDWKSLADAAFWNYPTTATNAINVGKCLAEFIQNLRINRAHDIHVIGYSLGAQVAANAAHNLRPYKLPRITGLDPAGPWFLTLPITQKLDKSDANFVDVIHTSAGLQGMAEPCGDADFYMNGGAIKPGCLLPFCSHRRGAEYFIESINSKVGFWGWPCSSYTKGVPPVSPVSGCQVSPFSKVPAGDQAIASYQGIFLVNTNSEAPFAKKWTK